MNQSESWPKQSKDLKYHFKYQIPIPLQFNQKKGQYRYNTGKCSTLAVHNLFIVQFVLVCSKTQRSDRLDRHRSTSLHGAPHARTAHDARISHVPDTDARHRGCSASQGREPIRTEPCGPTSRHTWPPARADRSTASKAHRPIHTNRALLRSTHTRPSTPWWHGGSFATPVPRSPSSPRSPRGRAPPTRWALSSGLLRPPPASSGLLRPR